MELHGDARYTDSRAVQEYPCESGWDETYAVYSLTFRSERSAVDVQRRHEGPQEVVSFECPDLVPVPG